jgi:ketosteroid isomerase-like protein
MLSTAMSKNSEVIRTGYEAWNRDDRDAWLDVLHPAAEFQTSGVWPDFDPVYRGKQGLAEFWRRMHEPWQEFRIDIEELDEERATSLAGPLGELAERVELAPDVTRGAPPDV